MLRVLFRVFFRVFSLSNKRCPPFFSEWTWVLFKGFPKQPTQKVSLHMDAGCNLVPGSWWELTLKTEWFSLLVPLQNYRSFLGMCQYGGTLRMVGVLSFPFRAQAKTATSV